MFKTSILIGTMLASNLAGVCCAVGMPAMEMHHHGMMTDSGYSDNESVPQVQPITTHCGSQAVNVSQSDRDLENGSNLNQRFSRGTCVPHIDYLNATQVPLVPAIAPQSYFHHGCGFHHGASPPLILEQSSGNQLLF